MTMLAQEAKQLLRPPLEQRLLTPIQFLRGIPAWNSHRRPLAFCVYGGANHTLGIEVDPEVVTDRNDLVFEPIGALVARCILTLRDWSVRLVARSEGEHLTAVDVVKVLEGETKQVESPPILQLISTQTRPTSETRVFRPATQFEAPLTPAWRPPRSSAPCAPSARRGSAHPQRGKPKRQDGPISVVANPRMDF